MDSLQIDYASWPDVASKLLDYGRSAIGVLSERIQDVSPYTWELAQRQVIVETTVDLYSSLTFFVACVLLFAVGIFFLHKEKDDFIIGWCFVPAIIGGLISTAFVIINARLYFLITSNPDYYTIKRLIEMSVGNL